MAKSFLFDSQGEWYVAQVGHLEAMDLAEQAEKTLMVADSRLLISALSASGTGRLSSAALMAMMPFFSSFLLDSYKYLTLKSPERARAIAPATELLKHSRLRLKPLEVRDKRFDEILKDTGELARLNSRWFTHSRPAILRFLYKSVQKDLGIFFMDGEVVSTTHLALMNLGVTEELVEERALSLGNLGQFMFEAATDYGSYLSALCVTLLEEVSDSSCLQADYRHHLLALGPAFERLEEEQGEYPLAGEVAAETYRDVHADRFYEQLAKARGQEETAVFILFLAALSQVNVARLLVPRVSEGNTLSALKIRFLSLYHAAHTLNKLSNQSQRLGFVYPQAIACIRDSLGNRFVRRIRKLKGLRNNLIHYGIPEHVVPRLTEDLPFCGLIEAHTNGGSPEDLGNEVSIGLDHISQTLTPLLPAGLASGNRRF